MDRNRWGEVNEKRWTASKLIQVCLRILELGKKKQSGIYALGTIKRRDIKKHQL